MADLLLLTIVFLSLRLPFVIYAPKGIDVYCHLLEAEHFKRGKRPSKLSCFAYYNDYIHPPLFHQLLSFTPKRFRAKMPLLIDLIFDFGNILLCYFTALILFGEIVAFLSTAIYIFTPIAFMEGTSQTPRPLGLFFYNLSFFLLFNSTISFFAFIPIALCLLTHKFATQTFAFTFLLLSPLLVLSNPLSPFIFLLGFGLAVILSHSFYITILKDHASTIKFYLKHGDWKRQKKFGNPKDIAKFNAYCFIPLLGLILNPLFMLNLGFLFAWFLSVLAIFFAWRWGDNYRYLAFLTLPASILSAHLLFSILPLFLIIPPLALSIFVIYRSVKNFVAQPKYDGLSELQISENAIILVYPTRLMYETAYRTRRKVIYGANEQALEFELLELTPLIKQDIAEVLEKYRITHLFIDEKEKDVIQKIPVTFKEVVQIRDYILFERRDFK